jgi:hypothetical protein
MRCCYVFGAGEALFQTGWFIESMATQVLVVFCIRTRRKVLLEQAEPISRGHVSIGGGCGDRASASPHWQVVRVCDATPDDFRLRHSRDRRVSGACRSHKSLFLSSRDKTPMIPARQRERHRMAKSGWLRAAVLGANDGILSTSSLVLGVAAAHGSHSSVLIAGVAGVVAGAMSMAAGEFVSVSLSGGYREGGPCT